MNEETILDNRTMVGNTKKAGASANQAQAWKYVTLGGIPGILMGAGLMYAEQLAAKGPDEEVSPVDTSPQDSSTAETDVPPTSTAEETSAPVASVDEGLSFGQAFAAARAAVGPGGVFEWHGGLYNTYTADEWNAMTAEQKDDFAQQVHPITPITHLQAPTDAHPYVVVVHDMQSTSDHPSDNGTHEATSSHDDVRIVGTSEYQGHAVVGLDLDGDNQADVAVIDVDDNYELSDPDVVVTRDGDVAMVGDIRESHDGDVSVVSDGTSPQSGQDGDVHVVGHTTYGGYDVYGIDLTGDNQADVAVIDVDASGGLSDPDVVFDGDGNYATVEDIMNATDPNADYYQTDNSDVMDYSDSADFDAGQLI